MGFSLKRIAWLLAAAGGVLFVAGAALSNDLVIRGGLIAALTGLTWSLSLRNRRGT